MTSPAPVSFNIGPSQLGPGVAQDIAEVVESGLLSMSHRGDDVKNVVMHAVAATKQAMRIPDDYAMVFQPSATAAMETIAQQLVGERRMHIVQGAFGQRFADTPGRAHAYPTNADPERLDAFLSQPIAPKLGVVRIFTGIDDDTLSEMHRRMASTFVAITHNETSTGHMWSADALRRLRAKIDPEAVLAVDVTSSFGALAMDWSLGDVWFGSVQKCLGLPAGLGFMLLSPRAVARAEESAEGRANLSDPDAKWRSIPELVRRIATGQTVETPNVLAIALLGRVMSRWDVDLVERRVRRNAALVAEAGLGRFHVEEPEWRSITVHNLHVDDPDAMHERARAGGFVIGRGYGELRESCIRIATFPAHTTEQVEALIAALR